MSVNYLTVTYVDYLLGKPVRQALFTEGTTYKSLAFTATAQAASAVIRNAILSAGYVAPTTTSDDFIKLGTLGEFVRMAYSRPDKRIELPENFTDSAMNIARKAILSGEAKLELTLTAVAGIGGISFSDHADTTLGHPTIFSRRDLSEY